MTTYYLLVVFAAFLDSLNDDWRDRPNDKEESRVHLFFQWLRVKVGWEKVWVWYLGTKSGHPPKRIGGIVFDYWHNVKVVKNLVLIIGAPIALAMFTDSLAWFIIHACIGYAVAGLTFVLFYNYLWPVKINAQS